MEGMQNKDLLQALLRRAEVLFNSQERVNAEAIWSDLAEFMLNNQSGIFMGKATGSTLGNIAAVNSGVGSKRTNRVFDSTALQASQDLASSIQGTLTNPSTVWSNLRFQDEALNNNDEAIAWLEKVNNLIHKALSESNFDTEIAKGYQSLVALANLILLHEDTDTEEGGAFGGFRFTSLHLAQIAWSENFQGQVDTVFRKFTMSARQAYQRWPDDCSDAIHKALEKEPDTEFEFLHCIYPREKKDVKLNKAGLAPADKRPIASVYIEMTSQKILEEGGYYELPIYVARWSVMPNEQYGRGPGHLAIPDVKSLNKLKMRALEAVDLMVKPMWFVNQRDIFGTLDLRSGGVSVVKDHNGIREYVPQARQDIVQFSIEDLRLSIRSIFYLDKIQPLASLEKKERMSQLEVVKRLEEMSAVLGPVVSRLNSELLSPLIIRSFKMLLRAGVLPPMPAILAERGISIDINYVNQLARAQQAQDVSTTQEWLQNMAMLAQVKPEVLDLINADEVGRLTAKRLGVSEALLVSREDVEATRQERQKQLQMQQQLQAASMVADSASKISGMIPGSGGAA